MDNTNNMTSDKDLALFFGLRGFCLYKTGKLSEAKKDLEAALEKDPEGIRYAVFLGRIALQENDSTRASRYFKAALEIAPDKLDVKYGLAKILVDTKKYDEAFELDTQDNNILEMIFTDIFKFSGACKKCGKCCQNMQLIYQNNIIGSEEEFYAVCKSDPSFKRWIPSRNANGFLSFSCKCLNPDGTCGDYEKRQPLCRKYPNHTTSCLLPGCGFKPYINLLPYQITSILLLNKIGERAAERGMYEELLPLLRIDTGDFKENIASAPEMPVFHNAGVM